MARISLISYDMSRMEEALTILKQIEISDDDLKEISLKMGEAMSQGLKKETHNQASIKMYPTYVQKVPTGSGNTLNVF